jgi:hypothetical protein
LWQAMQEAANMQEFVGHCKVCSKEIYCKDGFLDGIILQDKSLVCFDCTNEEKEEEQDVLSSI